MSEIIQKACRASFQQIAMHWGVSLEACEFGPDHTHLFITKWKNFAVAQLAQFFKGASARQMRKDFPEFFRRMRTGKSMWTDGYFYETCGSVTADARKFYIERCQKKHWIGLDFNDTPPLLSGG
jgi:putative transposase